MKNRIRRIVSAALAVLLMLSMLAVLGACSDKKETKRYRAGEEASIGNWKVKPTSVEFSQSVSIGNNLNSTRTDENLFGIVNLTVTNTGTEDDFFGGMLEIEGELVIRLICDGTQYKPSLTMNTEDDLIAYKVARGETKDGFLAFVVPAQAADASEIALRISLGKTVIEYTLGK